MIYRIRMWWWLRKWRRLVTDLYDARENMATADVTYSLAQNQFAFEVWDCYRETVEILKRELAEHEARRPRK